MGPTLKFFGLLVATLLSLFLLRISGLLVFDGRQILSIFIFSMFIYGTLLFGEFRLAFAFGGIALLMVCNLITVERFTQSASLDVLTFLIGTFLVIGFLEESRFFEHIVSAIVGWIGPRPQSLLIVLMTIASLSSALVGEVTAILFMAGAMLHLTGKYKLDPIPFVIMLVFACNNGSAMSSVGNPIGVLIALKTGLGFSDFLMWAAPVALVVNVVVYGICRWYFADAFTAFANAVQNEFAARRRGLAIPVGNAVAVSPDGTVSGLIGSGSEMDPEFAAEPLGINGPENPVTGSFYNPEQADSMDDLDASRTYQLCWAILSGLILLLITHKQIEGLLGLREGTMMVAAALIMGSIVLLIQGNKARELVERRIDWWTLSFFMMLFASVGTLQDTKVTEVIAAKLSSSVHSQTAVIQVIGWATGWLSAFLDNVLAVATFMPVVHDVRVKAGVPYSSAVYWFMLFGGTFMGNMTIIGSTANIVAVGLLEKRGHGTIKFGYWMKIGFLVSIASMIVATLMLMVQSRWIPTLLPPTAGQ